MIKKTIKKKLNEKKWYRLYLTEEGDFQTTLRIPTFDRIELENKHRTTLEVEDGVFINGYHLYLSKEEEVIFRTTYKNYIIWFEETSDDDHKYQLVLK